MNRILTALVLLLVAGVALADDIGTAKTFASGLTPPSTDYSVAYLSQIFGTVGNVLVGTSGQIIGKMFAIFNKGVLVVAALWLCMTTVQMCLRAATEGSFMGQNKSVHMIMLRIALGFGLIIPSSATGYSLLQDIFMKIVVSGVALADQTWDAALNYIEYGGQLFIPPSTLTSDPGIISKMIGTGSVQSGTKPPHLDLKPVTQIFQDEVCMIKSSTNEWQPTPPKPNGAGHVDSFSPGYDYAHGKINFPGAGEAHDNINVNGCGTATSYFCAGSILCTGQHSGEALSGTDRAKFDYSYSALKQLVDALLPVAQSYAQVTTPIGVVPTAAEEAARDKVFAKGILVGILGYGNLITPYQNLISSVNQLTDSDKLKTAKAQGWIMAGSFYWNVEQDNNISSGVSISSLLPKVTPPSVELYRKHSRYMADTANSVTQTYATYIAALWKQYVGAQQNDITVSGGTESEGGGVTSQLVGNAVGKMVTANFSPETGGNYNPIVTLMSEGNNLLQIVVGIWITTISISSIAAIGAGFCNSTSPGGLIFKTIMSWMKSILMIVTGALLVPGAILAYYVPMYPFAVFTFAAIGWFGMVLEGMAAAPLVCLGVTHPEGHDFLGKAEQALMLFLSIFLRPALMVIGVIAFMVISFVAFEMLIAGYGTLLSGLSSTAGTDSSFSGDGLLQLITKTMVLVIFGFMTMELIEQCAKFIYQVPNNINRWIGAPGMGEEYGQMASAVKGAVSSAAEQGGKGAQLGMETGESIAQMPGQGSQLREQIKPKGDVGVAGDSKDE